MLALTINITGKSLSDLENAIDEAKRHISNGMRGGFDGNDSGEFDFEITGDEEPSEED